MHAYSRQFYSVQPQNWLSHSLGVSNKDGGWKGRFLENLAARAGHNLAGITDS